MSQAILGFRLALQSRIQEQLESAKTELKNADIPRIRIQMFSDTVIAFCKLEIENPAGLFALSALLHAAGETMLRGLASEISIRGGFDIHIATEFDNWVKSSGTEETYFVTPGDIWGPAMKRAYHLSEKTNSYPRIMICRESMGFIERMLKCLEKNQKISSSQRDLIIKVARFIGNNLIIEDRIDGQLILDYLNKDIAPYDSQIIRNLIKPAVEFVRKSYVRYTQEGNLILGPRYWQLLSYMESRRHPNGLVAPTD